MKICFYIKFTLTLFFSCQLVFANSVQYIKDQYTERFHEFNTKYLSAECIELTHKIDNVLREEKDVDVGRSAEFHEKEVILKAAMATVIIFGLNDSDSIFDKREVLASGSILYKHFEILRLTELLTFDLLRQLDYGAANINNTKGYEDLYNFSGLTQNIFSKWFDDVLAVHKPGFVFGKIEKSNAEIKELKANQVGCGVTFGCVATHRMTSNSVVFISTYYTWTRPRGVFIRLPDLPKFNGRQKYIVIENPHFDVYQPAGRESPYTLRAHAVVFPDATPSMKSVETNVSISISNGEPEKISMNGNNVRIHIHDGTLSPNNAHISGLPYRPLESKEVYSFISHVDGLNNINADTLHFIVGEDIKRYILDIALPSKTFGDFLEQLSYIDEVLCLDFEQHLLKMLTFINHG